MKKLLLVLPFLALFASPVFAQDTGIFIGFNCNTLSPSATNSALCLQSINSGALTSGTLYRWSGGTWVSSNITDITGDLSSNYAGDTGSSDAYASCPATLLEEGAYIIGAVYAFKANTVNTGAATWDGCELGAKTIKKVSGGVLADLEDEDIPAGKIVIVQYDGTFWQMQSPAATVTGGGGASTDPGGADTQVQFNDAAAFGGEAGLTYNKATDVLTVVGGIITDDVVAPGGIDTCDGATECIDLDTSSLTATRTWTVLDVDGKVALTTGAVTNNNIPQFDASGRIIDSGVAVGDLGGGGTGDGDGAMLFAADVGGNVTCAATTFMAPGVNGAQSGEDIAFGAIPRAGTLNALSVTTSAIPASETLVITARKNSVDTAVTCTINATGTSCTDAVNTVAYAQFDTFSFELVCSGGSTAVDSVHVSASIQ